jgi:hypothetical protein
MARLRFRVAAIYLDEEEDVERIDAVVRDDTLPVINDLIGAVPVVSTARGGTELTITLDAVTIGKLFIAVGSLSPSIAGDRYKHTSEIWDSLSFVVHRMMDND